MRRRSPFINPYLFFMTDKTILITGGTTGIGLATAQLLSAEGAKVIVTGRNPETLASAKKVLTGAVVLPSDSGDLAAAQALGDEIKTFADHLDGAFLNAGVGTFQPMEAATPKNYDDMFNVNVRGLYFQLQSLLPLVGQSELGRIHVLRRRFYRPGYDVDLFGDEGCGHFPRQDPSGRVSPARRAGECVEPRDRLTPR